MKDASSTAFGRQWEEASDCDLCGATQWRPVGAICGRRYGLCAGCGVVRLDPIPTANATTASAATARALPGLPSLREGREHD
jgi:hypothetical protein